MNSHITKPVITEVVDAIAGIILPEINFAVCRLVESNLYDLALILLECKMKSTW